jgi:ferredoxin-type protein NapF
MTHVRLILTIVNGGQGNEIQCGAKSPAAMAKMLDRRSLFARFRGGPAQVRPPWTRSEADFTGACTQCGACIAACPTGLLTRGHARYPIADFTHTSCIFCGACADACKESCFDRSLPSPWGLKAQVSAQCVERKGVTCRICGETCEKSAIRFRPRGGGASDVIIDLATCTGCGACVSTCPVKAISMTHPELEPLESST